MTLQIFLLHMQYTGDICPEQINPARWQGMRQWWCTRLLTQEPIHYPDPEWSPHLRGERRRLIKPSETPEAIDVEALV